LEIEWWQRAEERDRAWPNGCAAPHYGGTKLGCYFYWYWRRHARL